MNAVLTPAPLTGRVQIPPSKSAAHRAILCAALADGTSHIHNIQLSQDIQATLDAVQALGGDYLLNADGSVVVRGIAQPPQQAEIDCCESGSTLRFLIPIAAALGCDTRFWGKGKLPQRPLTPYFLSMRDKGVRLFKKTNALPLHVCGRLQPGVFAIDGSISSQFVTGLLFALPLLDGDSDIQIIGRLESKPYADLTIDMLNRFGVRVEETPSGYHLPGKQAFKPQNITIEGDFSQAAFFEVLGCCGSPITICGLNKNSKQGDRQMLSLIQDCGGKVEWDRDQVTVSPGKLRGFTADVSNTPDLAPAIAVLGCLCEGKSSIVGAARLRIKESDRIASTAAFLNAIGGKVIPYPDRMEIQGVGRFAGGVVDSCNDHRITMAAAVAAAFSNAPVTILAAESINKSYPDFFRDYTALGGIVDGVNLG